MLLSGLIVEFSNAKALLKAIVILVVCWFNISPIVGGDSLTAVF